MSATPLSAASRLQSSALLAFFDVDKVSELFQRGASLKGTPKHREYQWDVRPDLADKVLMSLGFLHLREPNPYPDGVSVLGMGEWKALINKRCTKVIRVNKT